MANEKRYGGAIVVPDDVEMHSPVDIVDDMVEALRFYDSRTSAAKDNDLIRRGDLKNLLLKRSFFPAIVAAALKEIPKVDAIPIAVMKRAISGINAADQCDQAGRYDFELRNALKTVLEWYGSPLYEETERRTHG